MPFQYTNSKGQTYHLHVGRTKTGKPRYYFSMKSEGELVDAIPKGYEIYENPNAQVFLRKSRPQQIFDEEVAIVEHGIQRYTHLRHYKTDVRKNAIQIFAPNQDVDGLRQMIKGLNPMDCSEAAILRHVTYSPIMQFVLVDKAKRSFITRRYCFLGAIDDWIEIGDEDSLESLTGRYLRHVGKDSFYELF